MIAGFAIARLGADVPFWCCWVGSLAFVGALIWWRAPRRARETLPTERLISAMMTGMRYVRYSREMDATLIRAVAFFPFASAYLALLPLVARTQMRGGPEVYGALMAAIGAGSIAASFALKWLKARLGPDRGDFPYGLLRGRDVRKRRVGRSRQSRGAVLRPCRGCGGRADRDAAHLAMEAATGRRAESDPLDALASAVFPQSGRGR